MIEHKIPRGTSPRIRQTTLLVILPVLLAAGCIGTWIGSSKRIDGNFVAALVIFLVLVTVAVLIGYDIGKRSHSSYRLIEREDGITRTQDGLPPMTIAYSEISKIAEYGKQGLRVHGQGPQQQIDVPATLRDYSGLRERLKSRHAIESIPQSFQIKTVLLSVLAGLLTVAAVFIFRTSMDRTAIMASGLLLLVGCIAGVVITFRNPQSLRIVKWGSLLLLFPLLSIFLRLFAMITKP